MYTFVHTDMHTHEPKKVMYLSIIVTILLFNFSARKIIFELLIISLVELIMLRSSK